MPRVMSNNDLESIKNSISRYLSMREHSKQELVDKLLKKDYEKDLIMQCVEEFSEKDLQSDYRYAESFARAKFNDHKGEIFIRSSLREKGITTSLIDKIMLNYDYEDWLNQAILALEKNLPYYTSTAGAWAAAHSMKNLNQKELSILSLQELNNLDFIN